MPIRPATGGRLLRPSQVCLTVEDGLVSIEVDMSGFIDEIQRDCWMSGYALRSTAGLGQ
ncbi:hypothetical protein GCM10009789_11840 [Kribbella sancticallisti]|uniref:Uncharacterized protein n=1 Tax=Kribbella sancticallisti TaxID=460087 RepID=A0ABN2CPR2_9ACTN